MKSDEQNKSEIEGGAWQKVYQGGGDHLKRVIKEYEELGFEVKTLPLLLTECGQCAVCYEGSEQQYKLYIRTSLERDENT